MSHNILPSSKPQTSDSQPLGGVDPDYEALVRFLLGPFLESPESLKIDCERSSSRPRIWIRVAFEDSDKGRVFGRGGRNIQAIRTVVEGVAKAAGQVVSVDVYGIGGETERDESEESSPRSPRSSGRRDSSNGRSPRSAQRRS